MTKDIPFRVKLLTKTAKEPTRENAGDLWDLYADDFDVSIWKDLKHKTVYKIGNFTVFQRKTRNNDIPKTYQKVTLKPQGRILVKTGISLELPKQINNIGVYGKRKPWVYGDLETYTKYPNESLIAYAVADIHQCSDALEQRGLFIENKIITGGEVSFVAINNGHEPYTINKGDKIAQMLIRPLYPSKMEIVEHIEDTGRGGYGSTGK